jgi:hypothetical protein
VAEHLDEPLVGEGLAVPPDGAGADVDSLAHPGIGIQAVVASRDAGDRQQLQGVLVVGLADIAGEACGLYLGLPLPDALAGFM